MSDSSEQMAIEKTIAKKPLKVAIVGGGLVGALSASFFAKRGHEVHLYEYRDDIRAAELVKGRSINLSMSARARAALKAVDMEEALTRHGIAMESRMIHRVDGTQHAIPYDVKNKQCIYSIGRKYLNETLLTAAEKLPNVHLHFNHKLVSANLDEARLCFKMIKEDVLVEETADLVVGADGAFSAVRRQMMKQPMFDFSQTFIEHGYLELCIPPTETGQFAMKKNYLHIWPRGTFMMIALPNQDQSWTVTLFMPFTEFKSLDTPQRLLQFFCTYFPDSIPLIGEERLIADFFNAKPSPLVSIKCRPYHVKDKAIIIGDAAHAMVPFYGQGMNAGFEDCTLLDKLMAEHNDDLAKVLPEFSAIRNKDAEAICDLAVYNYIELRDLVNRKSFLMRKKLDDFLFWLLPNQWVPLYASVTFSEMRYHKCISNKKWQDKIIDRCMAAGGIVAALGFTFGVYNFKALFIDQQVENLLHILSFK